MGDCAWAAVRRFIARANKRRGWRDRGWDNRTEPEEEKRRQALHRALLLRRQQSSRGNAVARLGPFAFPACFDFRRVCVRDK
jgi:hypothetical protein